MALNLSAASILEKNKLMSDGAWLILLKIDLKTPATTLRLTRNDEVITWSGEQWTPFPFELDEIVDDAKGELQSVSLRVSNITRTMQYYLEQGKGGTGSTVTLYILNSKHLNEAAVFEVEFEVVDTKSEYMWVSFQLGASYPLMARRPERRLLKNFCCFAYAGIECGVSAVTKTAFPSCDKSLTACRARGNSTRYGGAPLIASGGLYV